MKWKQVSSSTRVAPAEGTPTHSVEQLPAVAEAVAARIGKRGPVRLGMFESVQAAQRACLADMGRMDREPAAG